jgi:N-acetyl-alpha-D-muramate 1-phosphate uridylyltransferase
MADSVAGVVLAAGAGTRLAPLTRLRPKALCPVDDVALVDHAIDRLATATSSIAVNAHHGLAQMEQHLLARRAPEVHLSIERELALGTAGALGLLREWIDGRPVLVTNADAWLPADLGGFVDGWDGERIRLLVVEDRERPDFGSARYCGVALLPWSDVAGLEPQPSGLYEVSWRYAFELGRLDLVDHEGGFVDCGSPADYLRANLLASGGASVVGRGSQVDATATLERSVVWPGAIVGPGEHLVDAIRAGDLTVLVR